MAGSVQRVGKGSTVQTQYLPEKLLWIFPQVSSADDGTAVWSVCLKAMALLYCSPWRKRQTYPCCQQTHVAIISQVQCE